ncbi:MAG: Dynamin family protein [Deltaproteobacteria bacterium]|nr:Dynamin family protein [Deltaproteobacteria bacterium]
MPDLSEKSVEIQNTQAARSHSGDSINTLLDRAIGMLDTPGAQVFSGLEKLRHLKARLESDHFNMAVLGQFKRGKSTLLNALLGEAILPSSVVPLTAIPTFIRWGSELRARILFEDEQPPKEYSAADADDLGQFLKRFVTEEANPENRLHVLQAEVYHSSPILKKGLVLIDTPGIGSTFQHNTETTLNFLPQCDAALFLISADPPITEVEISFLKEVRTKIDRLFFIFNKIDYLTGPDCETALGFFRKVLKEQAGISESSPIYPVSALRALNARISRDQEVLRECGFEDVQADLIDFLINEKTQVLRRALARKAGDVVTELLMRLHLEARSLQTPLEDLGERLSLLESKIREAERQRTSAGDLLTGDRRRTVEFLERQADDLRQKARNYFEDVVRKSTATSKSGESMEKAAREAIADSIPGFFERELGEISSEFDDHVTELLKPHQERADSLIEVVRRGAAELFDIPYRAPESSGAMEASRQPYWITHKWGSSLNPIPAGLWDWVLPGGIKKQIILKRVLKQVEDIVLYNVENLRWATLQNLDTAFRKFTSNLDLRLGETINATQGAIQAVIKRKTQQSDTVAGELARIEEKITGLEELERGFRDLSGRT